MLQELSPLPMLGRVMGFYTAIAMTTSLLGIWFFGWVTQSIGEPVGLLGIGIVLLLVAAASLVFTTRMSHVNTMNAMDRPLSIAVEDHPRAETRVGSTRAASLMQIVMGVGLVREARQLRGKARTRSLYH